MKHMFNLTHIFNSNWYLNTLVLLTPILVLIGLPILGSMYYSNAPTLLTNWVLVYLNNTESVTATMGVIFIPYIYYLGKRSDFRREGRSCIYQLLNSSNDLTTSNNLHLYKTTINKITELFGYSTTVMDARDAFIKMAHEPDDLIRNTNIQDSCNYLIKSIANELCITMTLNEIRKYKVYAPNGIAKQQTQQQTISNMIEVLLSKMVDDYDLIEPLILNLNELKRFGKGVREMSKENRELLFKHVLKK